MKQFEFIVRANLKDQQHADNLARRIREVVAAYESLSSDDDVNLLVQEVPKGIPNFPHP